MELNDRRPAERYRIYRLRYGELTCVASTATAENVLPVILDQLDPESGDTLVESDAIGVMDAAGKEGKNPVGEDGCYQGAGHWIINPFSTGDVSAMLTSATKEREEGPVRVKSYTTEVPHVGEAEHVKVTSGALWAYHSSYANGTGWITLRNLDSEAEETFETTVRAVDTPEHVAYLVALAQEHVGGDRE